MCGTLCTVLCADLDQALHRLTREDPSLQVSVNEETGQVCVCDGVMVCVCVCDGVMVCVCVCDGVMLCVMV